MKIIKGDALEKLKTLDEESIDCVITSPPYWQLRDYGVSGQLGLEETLEEYLENLIKVFDEVWRVLKAEGTVFVNLGDTYSSANGKIIGNTERRGYGKHKGYESIARKTNIKSKSRLCIPERFSIKMIEAGWILRNKIIWKKPNVMPESADDRFTNDYEEIFFFTKSQKYYFEKQYEAYSLKTLTGFKDNEMPEGNKSLKAGESKVGMRDNKKWLAVTNDIGRNMRTVWDEMITEEEMIQEIGDIWEIGVKGIKEAHFATFPEKLVRRCLISGCPENGKVLDIFLGSGTTLKVAQDMGLDGIGIELKQEYIDIAVNRIGNNLFNSLQVI